MTSSFAHARPAYETAAENAAASAAVRIRRLETLADVRSAQLLFAQVWRTDAESPPITAEVLRAVEHAGGYVFGAYDGDTLIGASSGFVGVEADGKFRLHSHISGVLPQAQGRRVGWALKLHQRGWAISRNIEEISWTFDPLVRRNAWFNIRKLGARGIEYLVDFYGARQDGLNAGQPTDRLFTVWTLRPADNGVPDATAASRPGVSARLILDDENGRPVVCGPTGAGPSLIRLPEDVESLRSTSPAVAEAWQLAVRAVLVPLLAAGQQVTGMQDGCLVVDEPSVAREEGSASR